MNTELSGAKKIFKRYLKPFKALIITTMIMAALSSLLNTLPSSIIGDTIQYLEDAVSAARNASAPNMPTHIPIVMSGIYRFAGMLVFCYVANNIFYYLANYIVGGVVQSSMFNLRKDINSKINRLPVSFFDRNKLGSVLNVVTNDVDTVSNALQQSFIQVICAILDVVISYILMFKRSPTNAFRALLLIPLVIFTATTIFKISQKHFLSLQNGLGGMNGYIQEHFNGFSVNKLFNKEEDSIEGFKKWNEEIKNSGFKANFMSATVTPSLEFLCHLTYITMIVLTTMQAFAGTMSTGDVVAFNMLMWLISPPMSRITQQSGSIQAAMASMKRIMDFMEQKEETPDRKQYEEFNTDNFDGHVEFEHVKFSYVSNKPLITDLSFEAKPGQMIAIVGPTGAGKTTLINLLMRFYDPDSGTICVDGVNTIDMRRADLRSLFGMVLQDTWLYNDTIMENIRFGNLDATDEEVIAAAKTANVDHFIRTLPDGYNMILNEDSSNISQGQKQLLTIARVMVSDPKILILDEATSSVDTRLEVLIQEAMQKIMENRTSFVIAHRLSTIRDADLILVMQNGNIVEKGNHDELIAQEGLYYNLYISQFSEEEE